MSLSLSSVVNGCLSLSLSLVVLSMFLSFVLSVSVPSIGFGLLESWLTLSSDCLERLLAIEASRLRVEGLKADSRGSLSVGNVCPGKIAKKKRKKKFRIE